MGQWREEEKGALGNIQLKKWGKKKEAPARKTEQECKIRKRTEAGESFRRKTWSALERCKEVKSLHGFLLTSL